MRNENMAERKAAPGSGPLGWLKQRLSELRPAGGSEVIVSRGSGDNGSPRTPDRQVASGFTQTRVLAVSRDTFRKNRIVATEEMSPIADQFKLLRTHLFRRTRPEGMNAIQITGFSTGEGKSLVAANLAICIARDARQTTLLVDADFRRPSLHEYLGLSPELPGLKHHFLDGVPLEDILVSPGIDKLTFLPAGGRISQSTELIGSPEMENLIQELKTRYADRYVIIDTPPISDCPDPLVLSEYVDGLILVARADHTRSDAVAAVMGQVPRHKVLGLVLNDCQSGDQ